MLIYFPGADVGSNHDMVMITFQTRFKKSRKPTKPRIRLDLEKLNDRTVMSAFQATIDDRFAIFAKLVDEDADLDSMVTHFNKAVTDTAAELLGKHHESQMSGTAQCINLHVEIKHLRACILSAKVTECCIFMQIFRRVHDNKSDDNGC